MTTATKASYKLIKKIKSDKFNVENLQHYTLLLNIGVRDFQVGIVDSDKNTCLLLEDYVLASVQSNIELVDVLSKIFEEHHLLTAGFWKSVKISFKNNKFSLVPSSLFVKDALQDYLKINCQVDPETEEFLYYKNIRSGAVTVFAVNKELYVWLNTVYKNAELGFIHQSCVLTEGVLNARKNYPKKSVYLYIDRFKIHLITLQGKSLQYYNQFPIKQFSDYIKYIMLVMKGLGYDQKTSNVVLWGYIGKQSPHYNEFYKYIKNISFGDRPDFLKFDYPFDEVQDHHFFDLYNAYLCD